MPVSTQNQAEKGKHAHFCSCSYQVMHITSLRHCPFSLGASYSRRKSTPAQWWSLPVFRLVDSLSNHSMALANLNKSRDFMKNTTITSKFISAYYQLTSSFPDPNSQYIKLKSFIFIHSHLFSSHTVYCSKSTGWKTGEIHHCVDSYCATMNAWGRLILAPHFIRQWYLNP